MKTSRHTNNPVLRSIPGGLVGPRFADELAERRSEEAFDRWGKYEGIQPTIKIHLNDEIVHIVNVEPDQHLREG